MRGYICAKPVVTTKLGSIDLFGGLSNLKRALLTPLATGLNIYRLLRNWPRNEFKWTIGSLGQQI